jgi:hypothetical protein
VSGIYLPGVPVIVFIVWAHYRSKQKWSHLRPTNRENKEN